MIMADTVVKEKPSSAASVDALVPRGMHLCYEKVRAYQINKGRAITIADNDTRLIGADLIDSVSSDLAKVFDRLMEISLGD